MKKLALPNNAYNFGSSNVNGNDFALYGIQKTQEGNAAIDDAIKYLQGLKKSYPLYWSDSLYNSTKAHVSDLQAGKVMHSNNDSAEFT